MRWPLIKLFIGHPGARQRSGLFTRWVVSSVSLTPKDVLACLRARNPAARDAPIRAIRILLTPTAIPAVKKVEQYDRPTHSA